MSRVPASLALMAGLAAGAAAGAYRPRVGQRHADFTLPTIADGKALSLSQLRGKKVLLVHFASW